MRAPKVLSQGLVLLNYKHSGWRTGKLTGVSRRISDEAKQKRAQRPLLYML